MDRLACTLPGGYYDAEGRLHHEAVLAPLSGREEELLARHGSSAELVTEVLGRCLARLGEVEEVTRSVVRNLLVGDRQYLLLKLRQVTFGDRVQGVAACAWPGCGEKVDVDFSLDDIPVQRIEGRSPSLSMVLDEEAAPVGEDGELYRDVVFRLPNGGDQERLAPLLETNEAEALRRLLGRCVLSLGGRASPSPELIAGLSPRACADIESEMLAQAPGIGLEMVADCPECGRKFTLPFELQDFFFGELRTTHDLLYREVHYLAYHYHWSESEILGMSRDKRRGYIEVLADEIEKLNHAV